MNDRAVVIVAAGNGTRMGKPDKALMNIGGEPAIVHSLQAASATERVGLIVIVTRDDLIAEMAQIASDQENEILVSVVPGGATRTESVASGVRKANELGFAYVAVHDAARPLVTPTMFADVFDAANRTGAAILAVPVADTLKRVGEDGMITATVDRTELWSAQTPQAFQTRTVLDLLESAIGSGRSATDEAGLYEASDRPVTVVRGDASNIKLTWPGDEQLADFYIRQRASSEGSMA